MIVAIKTFEFCAAHSLPGHNGKCQHLHGHTYKLEVAVTRPQRLIMKGSSKGMVADFSDLKRVVQDRILDKLDHAFLNDLFRERTTTEHVAQWVFDILRPAIDDELDAVLNYIILWESPTSRVEVFR